MARAKIFSDTLFLSVSMVVYQGLLIIQSFLVMHFLGPNSYGIWLGLNIILAYGIYAHLGVEYGLALRLPYYQGQDKKEQVLKISDTGYLSWSIMTVIAALGVFLYGILAPNFSSIERVGFVIIAGLTISEQQIAYMVRWHYSGLKDFKTPSIMFVMRSILAFCLVVPLAYFFNLKGVMFGTLFVAALFVFIWWARTSYRFSAQVSAPAFIEMLKIGFPILLVVFGGKLIETADRILIVSFLGSKSLGYYGVAALGGGALYGLISQAGGAISPHIAEHFGKNNDSAMALKKYLFEPTLLFSYAMSVLLMVLVFLLPPVVFMFLPQYIPGLEAFYFLIPGFFFLGIILTANNILNLVLISKKQQWRVVYFQVIAIIVKVGCGFWFIKLGWDIAGVALASTLAYAVYGSIILWWASSHVLPNWQERMSFLADIMTPFVVVILASCFIFWLGSRFNPQHLVLKSLAQLFLCALTAIPLVIILNRKIGILKDIKPIINTLMLRMEGFF